MRGNSATFVLSVFVTLAACRLPAQETLPEPGPAETIAPGPILPGTATDSPVVDNQWRYRYYRDRWWYWLPSKQWVVSVNNKWVPYSPSLFAARTAPVYPTNRSYGYGGYSSRSNYPSYSTYPSYPSAQYYSRGYSSPGIRLSIGGIPFGGYGLNGYSGYGWNGGYGLYGAGGLYGGFGGSSFGTGLNYGGVGYNTGFGGYGSGSMGGLGNSYYGGGHNHYHGGGHHHH